MSASVIMKKNSFENNFKKKKVMRDNLDDEKRNI